jgi:hypothetical protein
MDAYRRPEDAVSPHQSTTAFEYPCAVARRPQWLVSGYVPPLLRLRSRRFGPRMGTERSRLGNRRFPCREPLAPQLGRACSLSGKKPVPTPGTDCSQGGRSSLVGNMPDGRNARPVGARHPIGPSSHGRYPLERSFDPKGLRPRCQPSTMPVPRETKQEQISSELKVVQACPEEGQVSGRAAPLRPLPGSGAKPPAAYPGRVPPIP